MSAPTEIVYGAACDVEEPFALSIFDPEYRLYTDFGKLPDSMAGYARGRLPVCSFTPSAQDPRSVSADQSIIPGTARFFNVQRENGRVTIYKRGTHPASLHQSQPSLDSSQIPAETVIDIYDDNTDFLHKLTGKRSSVAWDFGASGIDRDVKDCRSAITGGDLVIDLGKQSSAAIEARSKSLTEWQSGHQQSPFLPFPNQRSDLPPTRSRIVGEDSGDFELSCSSKDELLIQRATFQEDSLKSSDARQFMKATKNHVLSFKASSVHDRPGYQSAVPGSLTLSEVGQGTTS